MAAMVIVVNGQAVEQKYGDRAREIWSAVDDLISAHAGREINTQLVKLDDPEIPGGSEPLPGDPDWSAVKSAVDGVVGALEPDYLMLLGGPDLLPHCELENPAGDDGDAIVPSDLPYACDAAASTQAADFIAPTRVVSRLPDVPGATEPDVLLEELRFATSWESRDRQQYGPYLGITAEVWQGSTRLSLTQLYGNAGQMEISPPDGPGFEEAVLDRLSHFANLHGAPGSTQYFGQRGSSYPVAHDAAVVEGELEEGSVAAVEACYGAELFEPNGQLGMPFAYLRSGAYGFFGSTTIAYGPSDGNDFADVICRLFQASILKGASVGRAGLEARQEYVAQAAPLDPIDLKTLAQFLVLGNPAVQPVLAASHDVPQASAREGGGAAVAPAPHSAGVPERRRSLRSRGEALGDVASWTEPLQGEPEARIVEALRELSGVPDAGETKVSSFALRGGAEAHAKAMTADGPAEPATMHLLMQQVKVEEAPMAQRVAVVAVERDGQLVSVKTAVSR
jgi:hypothetical protein